MNLQTETWMGHKIRFVEKEPGDWWAVAADIASALGYAHTPHMNRRLDKEEKDSVRLTDRKAKRGNPNIAIISETGIYEAIFGSEKSEAKGFKRWVKQILKELRKASNLKSFEALQLLNPEHQKEAMAKLQTGLQNAGRVDYIKANTIANKAVSNMNGYPKMVKKADMTPEMLVQRQQVLDDTVELMSMVGKFGIGVSVSDVIYQKYH